MAEHQKVLRGLLLDPTDASIQWAYLPDSIDAINDMIGAQTFDIVHLPTFNLDAYVDDCGLLHEGDKYVTNIKSMDCPLVGKILLLGIDHETGDSISVPEDFDVSALIEDMELRLYRAKPEGDAEDAE